MPYDQATNIFTDEQGRRFSVAGSGDSEVLIPLERDPEVIASIERRNLAANEARARLQPQLNAARRRVAEIEREMREAGCFVPDWR